MSANLPLEVRCGVLMHVPARFLKKLTIRASVLLELKIRLEVFAGAYLLLCHHCVASEAGSELRHAVWDRDGWVFGGHLFSSVFYFSLLNFGLFIY